MKKFFLPVIMLALLVCNGATAQTNQKAPITVKKAPAQPVTKAPPIIVNKPQVLPAPVITKKPATPAPVAPAPKPAPVTKPAPVAAPAPAAKPKTVVIKKTTAPAKPKAPAKKAVTKKAKHAVPAPPTPPPPPPVTEQVILPRPTEQPPVIKETEKVIVTSGDELNRHHDEDNDNMGDHKKGCCHPCHPCCDKYGDQPWRFRHRHYSRYEYMNNFYDRNCESLCKKHCGHDKKDNDD